MGLAASDLQMMICNRRFISDCDSLSDNNVADYPDRQRPRRGQPSTDNVTKSCDTHFAGKQVMVMVKFASLRNTLLEFRLLVRIRRDW